MAFTEIAGKNRTNKKHPKCPVSNVLERNLKSVLIHGEIFGDYLEMATYLCDSNYKDAAAVIAGSTLESHLKQLCIKSGIPIEITIKSGLRPKKADVMNSELANTGTYSKLDQKNVTAWLGLRNNAAHGNYGAYTKEQVALMIDNIRDFITRNPG